MPTIFGSICVANSYIYTPGGTVKAGPALYILRQADEELLQLCQEGKYAYVLTSRQMGKSSLVVQTTLRLDGEGITSIMIDLSNIGTTDATAENWYRGVVLAIEDKLEEQGQSLSTDVYDWWETHSPLTITQRFIRFFRDVLLQDLDGQVVVFIDEIDTTLNLDFTDDFFIAIRSLYTARAQSPIYERLSFVLIGVATPSDLILDARRTPFNIGHRVDLTDFTPAEASPLAAGLGVNEADQAKVFERILDWSGGHPYLTQKLCIEVSRQSRPHWREEDVDGVVRQTFFGDLGNDDHNLQNVRDLLVDPRRCPDLYQVLTTYRAIWRDRQPVPDEEQSPIKAHLKLSGVVKRDAEKHLRVRNKIYQTVFDDQWIADHLPVNWGKRIKQLQRTIAASLLLVGVMAGLTGWALIERQTAAAERRTAEEQRREAIMERDNARRAESEAEQRRIDAEAATQLANQRQKEAAQAKEAEAKQRQEADRRTIEAQEASQQALLAQQTEKEQRRRAEKGEADAQEKARIAQEAEERANQQATIAQLREQAARVLNLLPTANAVPGVILAIDTMDRSLSEPAAEMFAQSSLLNAVQVMTEINRLQGHEDSALSVAWRGDGKRLVSGGGDGTVRIWDAETGQAVGQPMQHGGSVRSVAWRGDGKRLVSGGNDGTMRIWDAETGQAVGQPMQGHDAGVNSVAWRGDGKRIVSGGNDGTMRIWDAETGQTVGQPMQGHEGSVWSVAWRSDGKRIVSGGDDGAVQIWDAETRQAVGQPMQGHGQDGFFRMFDVVRSVAWRNDGKYIVSGGGDGTVRTWNAETGQPTGQPMQHGGAVQSVAWRGDGKRIVSGGSDGTMRIWDWLLDEPIGQPMRNYGNVVNSVAWSSDGKRIVSSSADGMLRIWDAEPDSPSGQPINQPVEDRVESLDWNGDSKRIVAGSSRGILSIWDAETGQLIAQPIQGHGGSVRSVAWRGDGKRLVSGGDDGTARIWDAETGQAVGQPMQGHGWSVWSVAWRGDGKRIVSGGDDGTVRIWDAETGQLIGQPMQGHRGRVNSVAWRGDGKRIVSGGGEDRTVRIWDAETGQLIGQPMQGHGGGVSSVAWRGDGKRIVSGGYQMVQIWDAESGQPLGQPLQGYESWVNSVAWSDDGKRIVTGGSGGVLRIWDAETGQPIGQPLQLQSNVIYEADKDRDIIYVDWDDKDKSIVSGSSAGGIVRLWDASPEGWLTIACNRLQHHPFLIQPETAFADREFILVAQRARAACQRRVWQHPSVTSQNSPSWLGRMFHHLAGVFTAPRESDKPAG